MSAEPQDARIGCLKRVVVGLPASSAGIGSPTANAKTSRRTSSPATPRSGSAVQAIEAPSVTHVTTIRPPSRRDPPGDPRRAGDRQAAGGEQAQPAKRLQEQLGYGARKRRPSTSTSSSGSSSSAPRVARPHLTSQHVRAQWVTGLGSCATEGPWDENDVLLVRHAVEAHIRAAAGSRFLPRCTYPSSTWTCPFAVSLSLAGRLSIGSLAPSFAIALESGAGAIAFAHMEDRVSTGRG